MSPAITSGSRADEWRGLIPANSRQGEVFPLPAAIAEHAALSPGRQYAANPMWTKDEIRQSSLELKVESADPSTSSSVPDRDFPVVFGNHYRHEAEVSRAPY